MRRLLLSGLLALCMATTAFGTTPTPRLEPIRRMASPEIRDTIYQPTIYVFEGIKGRELTLSLWAGRLTAELFTPSGRRLGVIEKEVSQWVGVLPESGVYRVLIRPKQEKTSFVLERDFRPQWTYNPERSFSISPGTTEASVTVKLSGYQIQPLTLRGKEGQTMKVTAKDVDVAIEAPSGQLLDQGDGEAIAKLPESGIYRILIVANQPIQALVKVVLQ